MGVLRWFGYIVAVLLALAVVAGGGFLIAVAVTIGGALMALIGIGTIAVLGWSEFYSNVIHRKRR